MIIWSIKQITKNSNKPPCFKKLQSLSWKPSDSNREFGHGDQDTITISI